jgi:UDP-N-acetylmuramoyl-tripeptide--D-alanyl-D-alanine ligase
MLTLEFIIEALTGRRLAGGHPITDVVIDSRRVTPGALFVALQGEKSDGHEYVGQALEQGALAAIISREVPGDHTCLDLRQPLTRGQVEAAPHPLCLRVENSLLALQELARVWRRRFDVRVIGITGSVGKTTTKELIADVLRQRYITLKSEGSYNNEIGLPLTLLHLTDRHEQVVLEMGMYDVGEIALLCDIARPQVGVVTIVAPVHLERAKTMERIIQAKTELVEALPPGPQGVAILNRDDANVMSMAERTQARIVTYGLDRQADVWADQIEGLGLEGIRFRLHRGADQFLIKLPLLGRHSVHTALRAAAVGLVEGLSWEEIITGLQTSSPQLRLVAVQGPRDSIILDDTYNASPDSVIAALNLLADLTPGRRIAVLGDMLELGSYERTGHERVARRAAEVADVLVTVGPRGRIIAEVALQQGMRPEVVHAMNDYQGAVDYLLAQVRPGDIVLVKGSRAVYMERVVSALGKTMGG